MEVNLTPWIPEQVSSAWLSNVLSKSSNYKDSKIIALTSQPISPGRGFSGQVHRYFIKYSHKASKTLPETIIGKFSSQNQVTKKFLRNYSINEISAYREFSQSIIQLLPKTYFMAINEKEGDICLFLEDLDSTSRYNVDLLSFEQYKFAVKKIAEFHAMWRKNPKPKWARPARALTGHTNKIMSRNIWRFLELYKAHVGNDFRNLLYEYPNQSHKIFPRSTNEYTTITHGDFRPDNFFISKSLSNSIELKVIDWQLASQGYGIWDISYLTSWGVPIENRREWEQQIKDIYRDTMDLGYQDYHLSTQMEVEYLRGFLIAIQILVIAASELSDQSERGEKLIRTTTDRINMIIEDHNLLTFLRNL